MKNIKRINMDGKRFNRLVVVSYAGNNKSKHAMWLCLCDCGNKKIIAGKDLRNGRTDSCGCYHKEVVASMNATHRMSRTPTYRTWASMLSRCYNIKQQCYDKYGAKGITVCERWKNSFEDFFADMGIRPKQKTLDRINPFGNYEPANCRWATAKEQSKNIRGRVAIALLKQLTGLSFSPGKAFKAGYTKK